MQWQWDVVCSSPVSLEASAEGMLGLPLSTLNGALVSQTHKAKPVIMPAVKKS